jgi:hypothetical protein
VSLRTISRTTALVAVVLIVFSCGGRTSSPSTTATPTPGGLQGIGAGLKGRPGLAATVYAQGLTHAAAVAFDDQGRFRKDLAAYRNARKVPGQRPSDRAAVGCHLGSILYLEREAGIEPTNLCLGRLGFAICI